MIALLDCTAALLAIVVGAIIGFVLGMMGDRNG